MLLRIVGLLVFGVGAQLAFLPTRPNRWSGLRLPWTLADAEIWNRANRVAGYLMALYATLFFLPLAARTILLLALPGATLAGSLAALYARRLYWLKYGTTCTEKPGPARPHPARKRS